VQRDKSRKWNRTKNQLKVTKTQTKNKTLSPDRLDSQCQNNWGWAGAGMGCGGHFEGVERVQWTKGRRNVWWEQTFALAARTYVCAFVAVASRIETRTGTGPTPWKTQTRPRSRPQRNRLTGRHWSTHQMNNTLP